MPQVVALLPDLLFGSKVQSALSVAGIECQLVGDTQAAGVASASAKLLIVDLTDDQLGGTELVREMNEANEIGALKTLGFYSHVEPQVKEAAVAAGFDLVVPRSRMNREGATLAAQLLAA